MWLVDIECTSYDSSSLQVCLSQCDASTLMSIRAAVVNSSVQLQEKLDIVEKNLAGTNLV